MTYMSSLRLLAYYPWLQLVCEDRYRPKFDMQDTKHFKFYRQMIQLSTTCKTESCSSKNCILKL